MHISFPCVPALFTRHAVDVLGPKKTPHYFDYFMGGRLTQSNYSYKGLGYDQIYFYIISFDSLKGFKFYKNYSSKIKFIRIKLIV